MSDHGDLQADDERCIFCDELELAELFEIYGHEFLVETCCEGMHESVIDFLGRDPREAGKWLGQKLSAYLPHRRVRRVADDGLGGLILDFHLEVADIEFEPMCDFVRRHHRHCRPPRGWRFGAAVRNGSTTVAVASIGRPVARALDPTRVVEVNRLCIDPTLPTPLVWNAASLLYGWAAREAKKRGFETIITYTLASESGTSLRAAGWTPDHITQARSWDTPSRRREDTGPTCQKVRWVRQLVDHPTFVLRGSMRRRDTREILKMRARVADDATSVAAPR